MREEHVLHAFGKGNARAPDLISVVVQRNDRVARNGTFERKSDLYVFALYHRLLGQFYLHETYFLAVIAVGKLHRVYGNALRRDLCDLRERVAVGFNPVADQKQFSRLRI